MLITFSDKMIKFLILYNLFRHCDILAKTREKMTTATTFVRQKSAKMTLVYACALVSMVKILSS